MAADPSFLDGFRFFVLNKIEQLFSAEDIVQSMQPLYKAANILGVLPFRIVYDKYGNSTLKFSRTFSVLPTLSMSFVVYCYIAYFPNVKHKRHTNEIISLVDYLLFTPLSLAFILAHVIPIKKSFSNLQQIAGIDTAFKNFQVTFPHEARKKSLTIHILLALLETSLIFVVYYFTIPIYNPNFSIYLSLRAIILHMAKILLSLKSYHVTASVKDRFKEINRQLLTDIKTSRARTNPSLEVKLSSLRNLHDELCDVCDVINVTEASPMLFGVSISFVIITANMFYTCNTWYNYGEYTAPVLVISTFISCQYGLHGMWLIPIFSKTCKEVKWYAVNLKDRDDHFW